MFINEQKRKHENEAINTDVRSLVKHHEIACGVQISKKPTYKISCVLSIPK